MKNHGVEHSMQSEEVQAKSRETCMKNHGVEHPMQDGAIAERVMKACFKTKTYTFPCGETRQVQGYEPRALDELVRQGYAASDIVTDRCKVPVVWWCDATGKAHRYYVDIFLPAENRMIEVKSEYTHAMDGVQEKARASREAGYTYDLWVF